MDKNPTVGDVFLLDDLVAMLDAMEDLEKAEPNESSPTDDAEPKVDDVGSDASGGDGDEVPVDGAGTLEFDIQVGGAAGGHIAPGGEHETDDEVVTTIDVKLMVQMLLKAMLETQNEIDEDGQPRALVIPQEYFDAMVQYRTADDEESSRDHGGSQ